MKKNLAILILLIFNQFIFSQEIEQLDDEVDEIIENLIGLDDDYLLDLITDLNKYHILIVSSDFNNKTFFLGRDLGIDQFNITSQLMYENHIGIFAGVSGTYYSEFDPKWDVTVLNVGYGKDFGESDNFRAELGYSRYIFSDSESNDFKNSIDLGLYAATKNDVIGSTISGSYLFGEKTGYQANISVYGTIKLFVLNSEKGTYVNFEPNFSLLFGSENIDTSRIDNLGIDLPFINQIIDAFETFSLRNSQLQLPIVFEFNNLNVETGFNINFPKAFTFENNVDSSTYFNVRLSYLFDLN